MGTSKKKLLVIGGGLAGLTAIVGLRKAGDKDTEIILVEPKNYCECFWTAYRSPFEEWVAKDSLFPLDVFCKKQSVKHIMTTVTNLKETEATLANGTTLPFDLCLVAVGADSKWSGLGRGLHKNVTREARLAHMKLEGEKLLKAKSVLVIGGGLIGSELAGDIAGYGGKDGPKVTLVQSKERLCLEMSGAGSEEVKRQLENAGVKVILNDRADEKGGKVFLKSTGEEIEAEEIVMTVGFHAINGFLDESLKGKALDDSGWLLTDKFLRVNGTNGKIYAFGDCTTTLPTAGNQYMRASIPAGKNMKASLESSDGTVDESKLFEVEAMFQVHCLTTGPSSGVVQMGPSFHTRFILPWLKNKTGFIFSAKEAVQL